ncbi:hypothetical protein [Burkholderia pyrrocinia]|uniref:hypothetical protein n=1 Tax=Burkholderia pyrrocinia TaxID=60550 RepID=UPI00104D14CE|nr:hypothetical protein [Burkholderia pyrrocinia]TDA48283.1 hypothetical protein EVG18_06300 [Burkholderia pyrrocinia]
MSLPVSIPSAASGGIQEVAMALAELAQNAQDKLIEDAKAAGSNPTQAQLAQIQVDGQVMQMAMEIATSTIKGMGEGLKGAAQKMN